MDPLETTEGLRRTVGYVRVSRLSPKRADQLDALKSAGCDPIVEEQTGAQAENRPVLHQLLSETLRPGDAFVVCRLDRASRSLKDLLEIVEACQRNGVRFVSLAEPLDSATSAGPVLLHVLRSLTGLTQTVRNERRLIGIASAKSRGVPMGRPHRLTAEQIALVRTALQSAQTVGAIAQRFGVSRHTIYRIQWADQKRKEGNMHEP